MRKLKGLKLHNPLINLAYRKRSNNAENKVFEFLKELYGKENVEDFRYPPKLTDEIDKVRRLLEGCVEREALQDEMIRLGTDKLNWLVKSIKEYIEKVPCGNQAEKDEILKKVNLIDERSRKMDGFDFCRLLGELKGTKFDFLVKSENGPFLVDAKAPFFRNIDSMGLSKNKGKEQYKIYARISHFLPFFLIAYVEEKNQFYRHKVKRNYPEKIKKEMWNGKKWVKVTSS